VIARHMAMWFIRNINNCSFQKIGKFFGNRDHSTIIHGINKIEVAMKLNTTVKMAVKNIEKEIKKVS
jgi:chromosomal replication initiator protein